MPKGLKGAGESFKKEFNKVKDKVDNILKDKHERAEGCLKIGIDFCHEKTGNKVTVEEVQNLSIERIDPIHEELKEYCTIQFAKLGILPCNELHALTRQSTSAEELFDL